MALEAGFSTPTPKVPAREVEGVPEFDQHVERHQQAEGILPPRIIDEVLDGYEYAALRQCLIREPNEMLLLL
jgi:hypothetical protein